MVKIVENARPPVMTLCPDHELVYIINMAREIDFEQPILMNLTKEKIHEKYNPYAGAIYLPHSERA